MKRATQSVAFLGPLQVSVTRKEAEVLAPGRGLVGCPRKVEGGLHRCITLSLLVFLGCIACSQ